MEIHYKIIGFALIGLALIHIIFPRIFHWKEELQHLSLINRQMMTVHTFFIALVVFLLGVLCVLETNDLIHTQLGRKISLGMAFFWGLRLFIQLFGYSSALWRGKRYETFVHILFTGLWIYMTIVFGSVGFGYPTLFG